MIRCTRNTLAITTFALIILFAKGSSGIAEMKEWEDPDYRHVLPDSVAIEATGGRQNRSSITYRQGLAGIGLGISYTANSGVKE